MSAHFHDFVTAPRHSIERERLLYLTAARELRLHAAVHGERLMITEPELDLEGFDFVVSSGFESVHIQSKGTLKKGGKRHWMIRAALLKSSFYNRDLMPDMDGQKVSGYATGATGGVLLHIIDQEAARAGLLEISYRYLDIYWLISVASGIAGEPHERRERALFLLRQMRDADDKQSIRLLFGDFVKLKSIIAISTLRLHIGGLLNWASGCHAGKDLALLADPAEISQSLWQGVRQVLG